jgi:hypothetical protein
MLELTVVDLVVPDPSFTVPSALGAWTFERVGSYADSLEAIETGRCANTYYARLPAGERPGGDVRHVAEGLHGF